MYINTVDTPNPLKINKIIICYLTYRKTNIKFVVIYKFIILGLIY